MKRILLGAMALVMSCAYANANALHLNPTQPESGWNMRTFGRTTIPIGYFEYCQRYQDRCERPAESSMVELSRERWKLMLETNNKVNTQVMPLTDREIFGVEEMWEYPDVVGDCEDYALMKRKMLNEMGFPLGALLMTVGRDADGGGHAVLTVVTDLGDFVLDNVEKRILLWKDTEIYYLKRQAQEDPNRWVSLTAR
ncbi:MAG: transglutaminase [Rhizobiales bacterium]|nr:transglutaminase [Hoeflea sp.]MBA67248.1 transglutaminase [Hyphomicrobiales bacterium]|tara:strand:+ start:623 stop:1213 length:591 start_codon:yes stop_codon:yes gene_type:complete